MHITIKMYKFSHLPILDFRTNHSFWSLSFGARFVRIQLDFFHRSISLFHCVICTINVAYTRNHMKMYNLYEIKLSKGGARKSCVLVYILCFIILGYIPLSFDKFCCNQYSCLRIIVVYVCVISVWSCLLQQTRNK